MLHRSVTIRRCIVGIAIAACSAPLVAQSASLSLEKSDAPDPVTAGGALVYTLTVTNEGPDPAANVMLSDPLPAGVTFQSLSSPVGWSCLTPAVGAAGTVSCAAAAQPVGSAVFVLTVGVGAGVANGTVLDNTATVGSDTADPHPGDESATATTTVTTAPATTVYVTKSGAPDPVQIGGQLTYTITAGNASALTLESATVTDVLPAETTFVSLVAPGGWSCTTPAAGANGTVQCTISGWPAGTATFTLVVTVATTVAGGASFTNVARLDVTDSGRSFAQVGSAVVHASSPASVSATKSVTGNFLAGGAVQYTIVLHNAGPATQSDAPGPEFTDVLPASLALTGASATSGVAVATPATNTVTWNGVIASGQNVTVSVYATVGAVAAGTVIANQGSVAFDADGNGTNEAAAQTDDPAVPGAADPTSFTAAVPLVAVPTLDDAGLAALAALALLAGLFLLRKGN